MAEYLSDFNLADGPVGSDITFLSGTGTIVGNRMRLVAGSPVKMAVRSEQLNRDNYVVSALLLAGPSFSTAQRVGLAFRIQDTGNFYYVSFKSGEFGNIFLYRMKGFSQTLLRTHPSSGNINVPVNTLHDFEISVSGTTEAVITVWFNGVEIFTFTDNTDPITAPGRVGIYMTDTAGDYAEVDDLHVIEGQATPVVTIAQQSQSIMMPKDDTTYPFSLSATATDEEDGDVSANIVWEQALDGGAWTQIGTGPNVNATLVTGVNNFRASVTDSALATTTSTVDITITPYDFGGVTPVANGFILGINGTHTPDTFAPVGGVRVLLVEVPSQGMVFINEDGSFTALGEVGQTSLSFKYRLQDQEGFSLPATVTVNFP